MKLKNSKVVDLSAVKEAILMLIIKEVKKVFNRDCNVKIKFYSIQ